MNKLIMMCGLPRSGKSTWVEMNRTDEIILSADTLRHLVYNQRFWVGGEPLVWSIHGVILRMLLKQGVPIIIDETNTTPKRRNSIIYMAKKHGYSVNCVWVTTSKEVCLSRAFEMGDNVIPRVIERMAREFVAPRVEEGFEKVIEVEMLDKN